jgi:hypothetical protein
MPGPFLLTENRYPFCLLLYKTLQYKRKSASNQGGQKTYLTGIV